MIRRDYILRMIEEIGKMIAAILGLLKKEQVLEAQKLYREGINRAFDMDENALLEASVNELKAIFEQKFGESFEGLEVVAGLLERGGDIHLKNEDENKTRLCYQKALELYKLAEIESGSFSLDRQAKMNKLTQIIAQL